MARRVNAWARVLKVVSNPTAVKRKRFALVSSSEWYCEFRGIVWPLPLHFSLARQPSVRFWHKYVRKRVFKTTVQKVVARGHIETARDMFILPMENLTQVRYIPKKNLQQLLRFLLTQDLSRFWKFSFNPYTKLEGIPHPTESLIYLRHLKKSTVLNNRIVSIL